MTATNALVQGCACFGAMLLLMVIGLALWIGQD